MPRRFRALASLAALAAMSMAQEPTREAELAAIRLEIRQLEVRLEQLGREARSVAGSLERVEVELELQDRKIAEAQTAAAVTTRELEDTQARIADLEPRLAATRANLRNALVRLYRVGRHGYLRLALSAETDEQLLGGLRQLRFLARRDSEALAEFVAARDALARERERLEAKDAEVKDWLGREQAARRELENLRRRQRGLLAELEEEQRLLAERAQSLAEKARRLEELLDSLYGGSSDPLGGTSMLRFKGVLDRPAAGPIRFGFGTRTDPRYRTEIPHNGIEIATSPGDRVAVVFPGKVLFAEILEGYGPTVVVHHPGRVFSLYAGLEELAATTDDVLSLGDTVGVAAERLYFEIRVENQPEDPLDWVR